MIQVYMITFEYQDHGLGTFNVVSLSSDPLSQKMLLYLSVSFFPAPSSRAHSTVCDLEAPFA